MKRCLAAVTVLCAFAITARSDESAVGHMVFFELKEKTPEAKKKLVDECYKYLKNHDGVIYFSAGPRAMDQKEAVSAADWDVALHLVFKDGAALKKYIASPDHVKFVNDNKASWKGVKVYDSHLDAERK